MITLAELGEPIVFRTLPAARAASCVIVLAPLIALPACSKGTATTQVTVTATVSAGPTTTTDTASSTDSSSIPVSTPSDILTDSASADPTGPVVLQPSRVGSPLTLSDFFDPQNWAEGSYDIADRKAIQGVETSVDQCLSDNPQSLELRLGDNFKSMAFQVGQANDSADGDQTLTVAVIANGKQSQVQNIKFNEIRSFTVDVTSVNSLKILFYLLQVPNRGCQGDVNAVLFKAIVK